MGIFWENGWPVFVLLTVVIGGGAAYMTGKSLANQWRGFGLAVFYIALLSAALRFLGYALFEGTLLSLQYFIVDFVVLLAMAMLGYRLQRVKQMVTQYAWLYERKNPFSWRDKTAN
jgi:hypothetical protein